MTTKQLQQSARRRILQLRRERLSQGHPFMINTPDLPPGHCYLEYPDGSIKIATADPGRLDFKIVEEVDYFNAAILKRQLKIK